MALKHYAGFNDLNGDKWWVNIYDEEYGGGTTFEFQLGEAGFELTWEGDINDRSVAIVPSRLSIPMMLQNNNDADLVDDLATGYEGQFFVEVKYGGAGPTLGDLYWRGILLADLTEFEDAYFPQEVQLTAVDDLANLQNIPYSFDPEATGYGKLKGHIANALNKLRPWVITTDTHRYTFADYVQARYDATNYTSGILNAELNFNRFKDSEANPPEYTSAYDVLNGVLSSMGARLYWHPSVNGSVDSGFVVDSLHAHQYDDDLLTGYTVDSGGTASATTLTREVFTLPSTEMKKAAGWMRGYRNPLQRVERTFEYGGSGPFVVDHLYDVTDSLGYLDALDVPIFTGATIHYQEGTPVSLRFKFRAQNTAYVTIEAARLRVSVRLKLGQYYAKRNQTYVGTTQYYVPSGIGSNVAVFSDGVPSWTTTASDRLFFVTPPFAIGEDGDYTFDFGIDMPGLPGDLTSEDCEIDFFSSVLLSDGTSAQPAGIYEDTPHEVREVRIFPTDVYDIDGANVTFQATNDNTTSNEVLELPDVGFADLINGKGGGLTVEVGGTRTQPSVWRTLAATGTTGNLHVIMAREWLLGQSSNIRTHRGTVYDLASSPSELPSMLHTYTLDSVDYALHTLTFRANMREWEMELVELKRAGSVTTPAIGFDGALPEVPGLPPIYTTNFNQQDVANEENHDATEAFAMFING